MIVIGSDSTTLQRRVGTDQNMFMIRDFGCFRSDHFSEEIGCRSKHVHDPWFGWVRFDLLSEKRRCWSKHVHDPWFWLLQIWPLFKEERVPTKTCSWSVIVVGSDLTCFQRRDGADQKHVHDPWFWLGQIWLVFRGERVPTKTCLWSVILVGSDLTTLPRRTGADENMFMIRDCVRFRFDHSSEERGCRPKHVQDPWLWSAQI